MCCVRSRYSAVILFIASHIQTYGKKSISISIRKKNVMSITDVVPMTTYVAIVNSKAKEGGRSSKGVETMPLNGRLLTEVVFISEVGHSFRFLVKCAGYNENLDIYTYPWCVPTHCTWS